MEHTRNSPKLNLFCVLSNYKVYGPFFFLEPTRVRQFMNNRLPNRWIGRASRDDMHLLSWPPRSPDITPCDFYLWGYVKDSVLYLHYRKIFEGYVTAS
ncbi:hypothetical protein C0J52_27106 [Blattella germanica]|nr:hypothetical protein C0J52_27106 [Blattella germanica]